jgi:hypothetical protein
MGTEALASLIGFLLVAFGFAIMRNPMRLALLSGGQQGYYQRLVLDTSHRNQLRAVGAIACVFGGVILTEFLGELLRVGAFSRVSNGLLVLLYLLFGSCFVAGIVLLIVQLAKGHELFDWFRLWKAGTELGSIDVVPAVTTKMRKEASLFTWAFLALVLITVAMSLLA